MGKHHQEPPKDEYLVRSNESCLKSTGRFIAYGTILGTNTAVIVAQNPVPGRTFPEVVGHSISRFIFPAALIGGVYASVTCLMDDVRGPYSPTSNGFIGGAAAGFVLSTKSSHPTLGKAAYYAFMFGMAGGIGRFFATKGLGRYDSAEQLAIYNKNSYISDVRHLEPTQTKQ